MPHTYTIAIPMAGLGTRMRPHTWSKPKPLIHLAGRTVLDYVLEQFHTLPRFSQAEFALILGPNQREQVEPYVVSHHGDKNVRYFLQEEMRGQSPALLLARGILKGRMLMAFSDTLIETNLAALDSEELDGVAWVQRVPDPRRFGVAETDENGLIRRLIEKPQEMHNNLALVGFYYFREGQALMEAIEEQMARDVALKGEYYLVDAINIMIERGAQFRVEMVDVWLDSGKPDALLETNRYLLANGADNSEAAMERKNVMVIPPVFIHPQAEVAGCVIGPHVSIDEGAQLTNTVIANSIVESDARVSHMVLEDALIGRRAVLTGRAQAFNIADDSWIEL